MWSAIVVVDVSYGNSGGAGGFAVEFAGVEQLFGKDSLVTLDLSVVAWGVRTGRLMPRLATDDPRKVVRAVVRSVVSDDAVNVGDAVGGEPDLRAGQERGGCWSRGSV